MKTASAKAKGRRLQNWVRDTLLDIWQNYLTENDIRSAIMGERGEDIKMSNVAQQLIDLSIECKNVEKLNVWKAYEQCKNNTRPNETSVLVIKRNGVKRPLVVVDAEYFLKLHYKNITRKQNDE